ncbi:RNA polymerase sigma-70 factor, ECF subfamily [Pseudobutyrivibrio sp. 49]|uniref:RNA polymerase sigma factor n=1 Tax=unclassified Pseudobutyrivibrio TaxID=2638619 RepID=UPI000891B07C|nr:MULTISPECIES: sigma-70 family RNA polymerase sigma factor [unclassified Pseudobutyrivibrio]SDH72895.1 RNA polymerase sigma-70 factor, ECF subfamily [Pseudobutyrivibrio sp. 49]SFN75286.1 RNA polymerase sigma-70 factor, ECF subfamily [Pseudobutyrivibrio sp. UC1225]
MNIKKICEDYYPLVLGYLLTLTNGNKDLAEDLTQDTFYRAIKNIESFRGDCKVSTWLCQIAKYTFWQYLDKSNKYKQVPLDEVMNISAGELVEEMYIREETNRAMYESIEKLDSQTKDVMLFRLTGEMSFKEIGELLDKTENWARVTFYRGKAKLGKEMNSYE